MNKSKRNILITFTIILGVIAEIATYQLFYGKGSTSKANENPKVDVVEKIQKIDKEIEELHSEEKITQENWIKEGDLLLEKEELEKELDREGYYKKHLLEDIKNGKSILNEITYYIDDKNSTSKQIEEGKERIERFGKLFNEYEEKAKQCDNYEELYNNLTNATNALSIEIREKYKD